MAGKAMPKERYRHVMQEGAQLYVFDLPACQRKRQNAYQAGEQLYDDNLNAACARDDERNTHVFRRRGDSQYLRKRLSQEFLRCLMNIWAQ